MKTIFLFFAFCPCSLAKTYFIRGHTKRSQPQKKILYVLKVVNKSWNNKIGKFGFKYLIFNGLYYKLFFCYYRFFEEDF